MTEDRNENGRTVILWDVDLVWVEELRERLRASGICCEEADDREELRQMLCRKSFIICILSEKAFAEAWEMFQKGQCCHVVLVLEHEDIEAELLALRVGVLDVLIKEKGAELAAERIRRLIIRTEEMEWHGLSGEREEIFEKAFSGIHFTNLEKKVLRELFTKEEQVVSRWELICRFWGKEEKNVRVVDTVVKQLRKKMKNTNYLIQGIYGKGYLLKKYCDRTIR